MIHSERYVAQPVLTYAVQSCKLLLRSADGFLVKSQFCEFVQGQQGYGKAVHTTIEWNFKSDSRLVATAFVYVIICAFGNSSFDVFCVFCLQVCVNIDLVI